MTPLPGAEKEAMNIAALFKASTVRTGAEATESLMKGGYGKLDRPDVVHFACHGIYNEKAPELSHLALTPDQKNDGKLEMHEIFELDWKGVSLVTMSACSSGKGKLGAGDDLIGLTRGFMFAGSPSILCSLWDVDDEATRALMVNFYENYLGGMSKPESLRLAQIAVMKKAKWSHPYYWSAFVLFGDWM
jgi:CHAT domain-containing protein